jgi:prepilin-type N-terminal cleavage/methylation domain-containing protein
MKNGFVKKQHGFTLVELLVVIAIIASLLSILLPVLGRSRQAAYKITCLNNLKQLGLAIEIYTQSYKYYPLCVPTDVNQSWPAFLAGGAKSNGQLLGVPVSLWPFHKTAALYKCPVLSKAGYDISYCYNWLMVNRLLWPLLCLRIFRPRKSRNPMNFNY